MISLNVNNLDIILIFWFNFFLWEIFHDKETLRVMGPR